MALKIAAGNWKMNLGPKAATALASELVETFPTDGATMILAVPYVDLQAVRMAIEHHPAIYLAAQNLHQADRGAYTGEVSAEMLVECGCTHVLVGHSERRQYNGEGSELLLAKLRQALRHGLTPIYCYGETLAQREAGETMAIIAAQLDEVAFQLETADFARIILAYEPVWAIGTGKTATPEQAQEVHAATRERIASRYDADISRDTSILYGGSVTPANAQQLFACPDIDGGLVGGASLKAADFLTIARSF